MADSPARRRRDSKPDAFASAATRRYAHTLRRDVFDVDESPLPVAPADPREDSRDDIMTIAMPRLERPAAPARDGDLAIPVVEGAPGAAAMPDSHRLTRPALLVPSGAAMPPAPVAPSEPREPTPPRARPRPEPREPTPPRAQPRPEPREPTPPRAQPRPEPREPTPPRAQPRAAHAPSPPRPVAPTVPRHPPAPKRALTLGLLPMVLFVVLAALALWFLHSI
jgi:hypothetical protein